MRCNFPHPKRPQCTNAACSRPVLLLQSGLGDFQQKMELVDHKRCREHETPDPEHFLSNAVWEKLAEAFAAAARHQGVVGVSALRSQTAVAFVPLGLRVDDVDVYACVPGRPSPAP